MHKYHPHHPRFSRAAKSLTTGVFLSYLYSWFTHTPIKLRVYREGKLWLVKSNKEITDECGLTRQETRTAANKAVAMGVVERKLWKFNRAPTVHYHLDVEKLLRLVATNQPPLVATNQSITVEHVEDVTTDIDTLLSVACATQEETDETMASKTAREVLADIQKKMAESPTKPMKVTAKSLSVFWQKTVPLHYDVGLQRPHTMKELGMFAQYAKLTGTHAVDAMRWAIENWDKFRYRVKEELDAETTVKPHIGSLLKGCAVAVEGYLKVSTPVNSPVPLQMSAPEVVGEPDEPKATKEEIEAMLKSIGR